MSDPTARTLRLLSLMQARRFWSGAELAARVEVSERTLRRDIDRLRQLGYDIVAAPGLDGGYQLRSSTAMPPLLVDDDEAVAIAVGLRVAAVHGLDDGEQTALSALAKVEQVLPRHLRRRVAALQAHTAPTAWGEQPRVGTEVLARLALGCRDRERLRFRYVSATGEETARSVEPHSLVSQGARWYLVAWDTVRQDWRSFRLDRMDNVQGTGVRGSERPLPTTDVTTMVRADRAAAEPTHHAVVVLRMGRSRFDREFRGWGGQSSDAGEGRIRWTLRGRSAREVLAYLLWFPEDVDWELLDADVGVREAAAVVRTRMNRLID